MRYDKVPQGLIHQLLLLQHGITGRKSERTCFLKLFKRTVALGVHIHMSITHTSMDFTHGISSVLTFVRKGFPTSKKEVFLNLATLITLLKSMDKCKKGCICVTVMFL